MIDIQDKQIAELLQEMKQQIQDLQKRVDYLEFIRANDYALRVARDNGRY
jgi:hypothetical protein